MSDLVYTVEETAALLRVHHNTLYQAIARDEFPHLKVGKSEVDPENETVG